MNEKRLTGMLGLCVRARQATFGEDAGRMAVQRGQCALLLLDGSVSGNTRKRFEALCGRESVPIRILPEGFMMNATGRSAMIMAVQPGSFAEQIVGCFLDPVSGDQQDI